MGQRLTGSGNFRNDWLEEGAGLKDRSVGSPSLPVQIRVSSWEGKQIDIMAVLLVLWPRPSSLAPSSLGKAISRVKSHWQFHRSVFGS